MLPKVSWIGIKSLFVDRFVNTDRHDIERFSLQHFHVLADIWACTCTKHGLKTLTNPTTSFTRICTFQMMNENRVDNVCSNRILKMVVRQHLPFLFSKMFQHYQQWPEYSGKDGNTEMLILFCTDVSIFVLCFSSESFHTTRPRAVSFNFFKKVLIHFCVHNTAAQCKLSLLYAYTTIDETVCLENGGFM